MKQKTKKILNSFKYAFSGIVQSFKTERNMKIHILIMTLVIIAGFVYKISTMEWIICIILFAIVISAELINTAIETVVDMITKEKREEARIAKDVAAGAVLVTAIAAGIVGVLIFLPKIIT